MSLNRIGIGIAIVLFSTFRCISHGQEDKAENQIYQQEMSTYQLSVGKEPLKFNKRAVLNWIGDTEFRGSVFLWTRDKRPEAIGQCFSFHKPGQKVYKHTFHSLASEPVTARLKDQPFWSAPATSVKYSVLDDVPPVAENEVRRLIQMRAICRQFALRVEGSTQGDLRLLPQPLVRYDAKKQNVIDGAIFAFSYGSDPEALLILEAIEGNPTPHWRYGIARFNLQESFAVRKQKQVWHVNGIRQYRSARLDTMMQYQPYREAPYVSFYSRRTEDLPEPAEQ